MIVVELRTTAPLLHLRLFGDRLFRSCTLVLVMAVSAFLGVLFVVPLFFQLALGLTALQSGLNTFPEAIGIMVGAQFASRFFYPHFGPRRLIAGRPGRGGRRHRADDPDRLHHRPVVDAPAHVRHGAGHGPGLHLTQAASFATVSHAETAQASSLFNSQRQLGSALGVAILTDRAGPGGHRARGGGPRRSPSWPATTPPSWWRPGLALVGSPAGAHRPGRRRRRHHGPPASHRSPAPRPSRRTPWPDAAG